MAGDLVTTSFDPVTWTLTGVWTLQDYLSTVERREKIVSNVFHCEPCKELKWRLSLYPDGKREESKGFLSLLLFPVDCNEDRIVDFSLNLNKDDYVVIFNNQQLKALVAKSLWLEKR